MAENGRLGDNRRVTLIDYLTGFFGVLVRLIIVLSAPLFILYLLLVAPFSEELKVGWLFWPSIKDLLWGLLNLTIVFGIATVLVFLGNFPLQNNPFGLIIIFADWLYRGRPEVGVGEGAEGFKLGPVETSLRAFITWWFFFLLFSALGNSKLPWIATILSGGTALFAVLVTVMTFAVGRGRLGESHANKWRVFIIGAILTIVLTYTVWDVLRLNTRTPVDPPGVTREMREETDRKLKELGFIKCQSLIITEVCWRT